MANCHITHIVSALDWKFEDNSPLIKGYQHLYIPVDDVEDENLIEWFPRSNRFIKQGLCYKPEAKGDSSPATLDGTRETGITREDGKSGVLVHW